MINTELEKLIELAARAPSGHNSQPWKFKVTEDEIEVYPDYDYKLPVVDPSHRELYISLGCVSENICVAAPSFGYVANRSICTDTGGEYSIKVELKKVKSVTEDSVVKTIRERQSNRNEYSGEKIEEEEIDQLKSVELEENINIHFYEKYSKEFNTIENYILQGNEIQMNDAKFKDELISWIRFNETHVDKTNNGLSYKVMGSPSMPKFIGKMIVKSFLTPDKQNKSDKEKIKSSSHFVLLSSKGNTANEWISLGLSLERVLLKLTELGVANAYLNPPCEIESLSNELRSSLQIGNEYPAIIMRIGYGEKTSYSPRRSAEQVMINSLEVEDNT